MGKDKTIKNHERDCNECRELEKEQTFIQTYRNFFKEDMREVVREEWHEHQNNTRRIDTIDKWMWKIGPVYLLTVAVVLIIIYLIIDKIS